MKFLSQYRSALCAAVVFVLAFDLAYLWQRTESAYDSEFGGHPDEAAHYVTGLMMRDYIAAHFPGSPMKYAETYYEHYPKIGLGIWPPVFYLVQSVWTLPFGVSRTSLMLLMCALAATLATQLYRTLEREFGLWLAALGALALISLPLTRMFYGMVMAETLSAVLMFGATLTLGKFLDEKRSRDAWLFGLLSGLAIMTKGTGMALALMTLLAIAISRQWSILRAPALWVGAAITAVLAGPWTWKFKDQGKGGWEQPTPSLHWSLDASRFFTVKFALALGWLVLALMITGLVVVFCRRYAQSRGGAVALDGSPAPASAAVTGKWAAMAGLIVAVPVFQSIIPAGKEERHLISALPAAMAFAMAGLAFFLEKIREARSKSPVGASSTTVVAPTLYLGFATIVVFLSFIFPIRSQRASGFGELAARAVKDLKPAQLTLVSSDACGEGMFIAEVALRDPHRPSFTVKRASKEFASSEWSGRDYHPKFTTDAELAEYLAKKFRFVVADETMPERLHKPHHELLHQAMTASPTEFWSIADATIWRDGREGATPAKLCQISATPENQSGNNPK